MDTIKILLRRGRTEKYLILCPEVVWRLEPAEVGESIVLPSLGVRLPQLQPQVVTGAEKLGVDRVIII